MFEAAFGFILLFIMVSFLWFLITSNGWEERRVIAQIGIIVFLFLIISGAIVPYYYHEWCISPPDESGFPWSLHYTYCYVQGPPPHEYPCVSGTNPIYFMNVGFLMLSIVVYFAGLRRVR